MNFPFMIGFIGRPFTNGLIINKVALEAKKVSANALYVTRCGFVGFKQEMTK